MPDKKIFSRIHGSILAGIGFILSPLSWWNDLLINFPLAYIIALPFGVISKALFLPAFVSAYWLTNILGLLLLQRGTQKILSKNEQATQLNTEIKKTFIYGSIYTIFIITLIALGILKFPTEFIAKLSPN